MQRHQSIFIYGFAIFAMFFGSGNLVFPLSIGFFSGNSWIYGFLGLLLTGIILPFLGLFVIKLHRGDYYSFFNEAGWLAKIVIPFFTLSLLGSFGVVPRCITVAHGGLSYILPDISLGIFALIFCAISFFLCLKDQTMLKALGQWMSPALLIVLFALIGVGIIQSPESSIVTAKDQAFVTGFFTGYQTMDLFAAFFFSTVIFKQIQQSLPSKTDDTKIIIFAVKASIIGSALLAIVYFGFVFLGAHYSTLLTDTLPEHMLPKIVSHVMGSYALFFLAFAMLISCLTTAMALNSIYANYICGLLKLDDKKFPIILLITTSVSFAISLLDFKAIAAFLAPALEVSYPGLIVLTIISICSRKHRELKTYLFWAITFICVYKFIIGN